MSYQDLAGFGRRAIDVEPERLTDEIVYQIAALDGFARIAGSAVTYVKPHGALYSRIVDDEVQAAAVVAAVRDFDARLPVLGLPGSVFLRIAAAAGLRVIHEGLADRAYLPDGRLVPRGTNGAVLHEPETIAWRVVRMVAGGVEGVDGSIASVSVRSICVHGDTPDAVKIVRRVRQTLVDSGITVRHFAPPGNGPGVNADSQVETTGR